MSAFRDLTGKRFGKLVVIAQHPERDHSLPRPQVQWICQCDCGNETVVTSARLNAGRKKSCGCLVLDQVIDRVGHRYGRLEVVAMAPRELWKGRDSMWFAVCDCGEFALVKSAGLAEGSTKSCGCLRREVASATQRRLCAEGRAPNYRHGHATDGANSPTYNSWCAMLRRCEKPNCSGWDNYGGRGITVCDDWLVFDNFLADMGERPEWADGGIDRIDVNGNYEPGNCRWATKQQQEQNKRPRAPKAA